MKVYLVFADRLWKRFFLSSFFYSSTLKNSIPVFPFLSQRWDDLLFLHWPISESALRLTLPNDLKVDLFDDRAWISVVAFKLTNLKIFPFRQLAWNDFLEVNLRTYVIGPDGQRGVWFYSLDSSDLLATWGARLLFGLPYHKSNISMCRETTGYVWESRRKSSEGFTSASISASTTFSNVSDCKNSLSDFLLERYCFWSKRKSSYFSFPSFVEHRPYDPVGLEDARYSGDLFRAQGLEEPECHPVLSHYCRGFDVVASPPPWFGRIAGQTNHSNV